MRTVAGVVLSVVTALAVVIGTVFAATVVVSPLNMQGWTFYNWSGAGIAEFVTGPGTPPSGLGSAHLSQGSSSSSDPELYRFGYNGVKLGQITSLSYYAYEPITDPSFNPLALRLFVSTELGQDALSFNPGFQSQGVVPHVWQQWNAMSGQWRSSVFGGEPQPGVFAGGTIAEYVAFLAVYYPSVEPYIVNSLPSPPDPGHAGVLFLKSGQAGEESYVDAFTVGINGVDTTYDFEPDVATTPTSTFTPTATFTATSTPTPTPTATATPCLGACPPTSTFTPTATHVSVGGIAEEPDVTRLPSATASSGRNYTMYIVGVAGAVLATLGAGAWAAWRRRRVS